ncbi:MAG: hypothetical protein WC470_01815 [Candidatus Paceibacterota bacterium]
MKNKKLFIILLLPFLALPVFAFAALENTYPALPNSPSPANGADFFTYVFNLAVIVAAVAAVSVIIYSGITILFSSGNMARITEAQDRIKGAIFGTFLLLAAYVLVTTINPELKKFEIKTLPDITQIVKIMSPGKPTPTVTYEEVPIGSIIESILNPVSTTAKERYNYSQLVNTDCSSFPDNNKDGKIDEKDVFLTEEKDLCHFAYDDNGKAIDQNADKKIDLLDMFTRKSEELCYLYDSVGNTVDRNNDGHIDERDMFEGLDLSVCMDQLISAIRKKISALNGFEDKCINDINTFGPINRMKAEIKEGCSPDKCNLFTDTGPNAMMHECAGCGVMTGGCQCCGGPRGEKDAGCLRPWNVLVNNFSGPSAERDPCTTRGKIDCERQEINYRIKGVPLPEKFLGCEYSPDIAPFIGTDGKLDPKFLLISTGMTRVDSFNTYFANRLSDLNKAEAEMKDKTKNVLTSAEVQSLKEGSQDEIKTSPMAATALYDVIGYHGNFNCTRYNEGKSTNLCNKGAIIKLDGIANENMTRFFPGEPDPEYPNDHLADAWPVLQKRIWGDLSSVKPNVGEGTYTDGEPATFYVLKDAGLKVNGQYSLSAQAGIIDYGASSNKCSLDTRINKESMVSLISIGQLADRTENYAGQLLQMINGTRNGIRNEIQNTINAAEQIIDLPEHCTCSQGSTNHCVVSNCGSDDDPVPYYTGCTSCVANSRKVCTCCVTCNNEMLPAEETKISLVDDWAKGQKDKKIKCGYTKEANGEYSTLCPCPGASARNVYSLAYLSLLNSDGTLKKVEDRPASWSTFKYYQAIDPIGTVQFPYLDSNRITSCRTVTMTNGNDYIGPGLGGQNTGVYLYKSYFTVQQVAMPDKNADCFDKINKEEVNSLNRNCTGSSFSNSGSLNWISGDTFETTKFAYCNPPGGGQGLNAPTINLPTNYRVAKLETISVDSFQPIANILRPGCMNYNTNETNWCAPDQGSNSIAYYPLSTCYPIHDPKVMECTKQTTNVLYRIKLVKYSNGTSTADYNICPIEDIKKQQCNIYKRITQATVADIENAAGSTSSGNSCANENVPGFLQRIELWQQRLWDFQYSVGLKIEDENRWTLLDMLTTVRSRATSCVQGYGAPHKDDLAKELLFSCQEGITANRLGALTVIPNFPYPALKNEKNCYPLNAWSLTIEEKQKCAANTERIGTVSDPGCQDIIKNYLDDYYCCSQGE